MSESKPDYTAYPQGFEYLSLAERQKLNPDICPSCLKPTSAKRIEKDIVGGKYLAYVIHICDSCGWWNIFKYWENRDGDIIHACCRAQPPLRELRIGYKTDKIEPQEIQKRLELYIANDAMSEM